MSVELKVPAAGESVTEVVIAEWLKDVGEHVTEDESVAVIETDKANMEIPAPAAGRLEKRLKQAGESALVGEVIGLIDETAAGQAPSPKPVKREEPAQEREKAPEQPPAAKAEPRVTPSAQRLLAQNDLRPTDVQATGPGGRILKEDVMRRLEQPPARAEEPAEAAQAAPSVPGRREEVVPMTLLRRRIAERLVQAQSNAALLTTFNEIDMSATMALRKQVQDAFKARYGIKLGFMSFFVKACIDALKLVPGVNARIDGTDIIYHDYCDIGVAVGGGRGLVVPVIRNAERLSFAEVELAIADFAVRAKDSKLRPDELTGGTFTISNGGIYGSMLSTPIINPPQSGILGMHNIIDRPVAVDGQVVIRPMMYVALTYDHRLVDGREAVTFLKRVKECIEAPERMLLEV